MSEQHRVRSVAGPSAALAAVAVAALGAAGLAVSGLSAQTFRSSVDLIAVDVQVMDRSGAPLSTLKPEDFEVTLDGRRRRVVSALFTRHELTPLPRDLTGRPDTTQPDAASAAPALLESPRGGGRTFIVAIDTSSFRASDTSVIVLAAQRFVRQLSPEDAVGVFTLPHGPRIEATTNHPEVRRLLGTVVGRKPPPSESSLTVEQIIDITATAATQSQLQTRQTVANMMSEESVSGDQVTCGGNVVLCTEAILAEADSLSHGLEEDVLQGLAGLDSLLQLLQDVPGRKTVLLLSGGMPVSDRSGGRPKVSTEVKRLGERATYANAIIHSVYFDQEVNAAFAADSRKPRAASTRTRGIYTRALAEFSEPSGGLLLDVSTGVGESEIDRLLGQISTYYVLGVEPDDRDRDGRPHRLGVKVAQRNVQVRNRQLVVVPRAQPQK